MHIINNWIHNNARGVYIEEVDEPVVIRNNTVADNSDYGIVRNGGAGAPDVSNCIVWGNSTAGLGGTFNSVTYSCIQGQPVYSGQGNINTDPCFVDANDDNYHLGPNSLCIDAGEPNSTDPNETDIDGQPRVVDGDGNDTELVDMGADEYYWSRADYDGNGIVNFFDYAIFADSWLIDDANISLDDDIYVDYFDLDLFCADWLSQKGEEKMMMMGCGMGAMEMPLAEELYALESPQDQPTPAYQTESQPSPPPEVEEPEPDPAVIEGLIEWYEQMLTDEVMRKQIIEEIGEENWDHFIETTINHIEALKDLL